jgi:hypothetical protein
MANEITREELEALMKYINGSLERIEKKLDDLDNKMDLQKDRETTCRREVDVKIEDVSKGKVPWPVLVVVGLMSAIITGLIVAFVTVI